MIVYFMVKRILLLMTLVFSALFFALSAPVNAQQKLVAAQSDISFVSKQMGVPVEGKFKKFEADLNFDPKKPDTSKIAFVVDLSSVDIGNAETEKELTKPGWFDSLKIPQAKFTSTSIKSLGGGKFEVAGKLAIKGNTRDVTAPISLTQAGGVTTARGEFTVKRLEFKIGDGDWNDTSLVANEVVVKVKLTIIGMGAL